MLVYLLEEQSSTAPSNEFYELEPAIVLDVILDETHPEIVNKRHLVDSRNIPQNYKGDEPTNKDIDYTYIGACKVRLCFSQQGLEKEKIIMGISNGIYWSSRIPIIK